MKGESKFKPNQVVLQYFLEKGEEATVRDLSMFTGFAQSFIRRGLNGGKYAGDTVSYQHKKGQAKHAWQRVKLPTNSYLPSREQLRTEILVHAGPDNLPDILTGKDFEVNHNVMAMFLTSGSPVTVKELSLDGKLSRATVRRKLKEGFMGDDVTAIIKSWNGDVFLRNSDEREIQAYVPSRHQLRLYLLELLKQKA